MMFGPISAQQLHSAMREILRCAIAAVSVQLDPVNAGKLRVDPKHNYRGVANADVVTTVDRASQAAAERARQQLLPWCGIIGEEDGLRVDCTLAGKTPNAAYITVDGIDGTRRLALYIRAGLKPDGISIMLSFIWQGKVVAAYIYNIATGDLYELSPVTGKATLVYGDPAKGQLNLSDMPRPRFKDGLVLVRPGEGIGTFHPLVQNLLGNSYFTGVREYVDLSIGLSMCELFTGKDGAVMHVQSADGNLTPWDDPPHFGIGSSIGFKYFRVSTDGLALEQFLPPQPYRPPWTRKYHVIVVHGGHVPELQHLVPVRLLPA